MKAQVALAVWLFVAANTFGATALHHYTFDGSGVADSIGSVNGSLLGGAALSSGMLTLDGTNAYVEFAEKLIPTNNFSLAFFAQALSLTSSLVEMISQGFTYGPGFYLGYNGPDHWIRVGDQWQSTYRQFPVDGLLHHYAVTTGDLGACLYIDGLCVATNPPIQVTSGGENTRLGQQYGSWGEFFHGNIDELWVFSGVLTASEVAQLAAANPRAPVLSIEVSQVRLCWPSLTSVLYQLQYRSDQTTNLWVNLGVPITGNSAISCITDDLTSPRRYYRVIVLP
jgi:hypothetical protein